MRGLDSFVWENFAKYLDFPTLVAPESGANEMLSKLLWSSTSGQLRLQLDNFFNQIPVLLSCDMPPWQRSETAEASGNRTRLFSLPIELSSNWVLNLKTFGMRSPSSSFRNWNLQIEWWRIFTEVEKIIRKYWEICVLSNTEIWIEEIRVSNQSFSRERFVRASF